MAEVINGRDDLTIILLNHNETKALTDLLEQHPTLNEDFHVLDELTNALLGVSND